MLHILHCVVKYGRTTCGIIYKTKPQNTCIFFQMKDNDFMGNFTTSMKWKNIELIKNKKIILSKTSFSLICKWFKYVDIKFHMTHILIFAT